MLYIMNASTTVSLQLCQIPRNALLLPQTCLQFGAAHMQGFLQTKEGSPFDSRLFEHPAESQLCQTKTESAHVELCLLFRQSQQASQLLILPCLQLPWCSTALGLGLFTPNADPCRCPQWHGGILCGLRGLVPGKSCVLKEKHQT